MPSLAETCLAAGRSHDNAASGRKLTELDAVRGIAAVVVFNLHFLGGVRGDVLARLSATPLYAAANGGAAVLLFFVLSGFVLTLAPLRAGRLRRLAGPAIRRYPRLAGPVVLTALLSVGLARYGGFPGVGWIGTRTGKLFPLDLFWGSQMNNGAIWPVLREAAFGTFFTGTSDHNPVLWTMKWELLGSVLAFALALVLLLPLPRAVRMAGAGLLAGAAAWHSIWLIAFPIGVAGALAHLRHGHAMRIPPLAAAVLFCAAAYVMSWNIEHAAGAWRWADSIPDRHRNYLWAFAQCVSGACMLAIALYCPLARRVLRTRLFSALGHLSFPLYLTHFFVLLSVGTWTCLAAFPNGVGLAWLPAFYVALLAASCALAYPIAAFDRRWIRLLFRFSPG